MSTGYFRVIVGRKGFSTVSTSVNNTTVPKKKILPHNKIVLLDRVVWIRFFYAPLKT